MERKKIIAVVLVMAVAGAAFVGYEFFVFKSLSGYIKVTLTQHELYSIQFSNNTVYHISYGDEILHVDRANYEIYIYNDSSVKDFDAIQGARASFEGLQIVVGNVNDNQLILYVKSGISNSKPIILQVNE
jgi:hypothetical protein